MSAAHYRQRWPILDDFSNAAADQGGLEVWLFGSALRNREGGRDRPDRPATSHTPPPADIDVLVIYSGRRDIGRVAALRNAGPWEDNLPPLRVIAMTDAEVEHYKFLNSTGAVRIL